MNTSTIIGNQDPSIAYIDRLTVKAVILNEKNEVLIINSGLLPGGGVEGGEEKIAALRREIIEEIGMTVSDIQELVGVIQYRDFLKRKYIIDGFTARYVDTAGHMSPQDEGEAHFTYGWYSIEDAKKLVDYSIKEIEKAPILLSDTYQGKLFNLKTTRVLLDAGLLY